MTHQTTITRERPGIDGSEEEIPITIEYVFHRASGDGWNEPREPAHFEIEYADDASGNDVALSKGEFEDICKELEEARQARLEHDEDDRPRGLHFTNHDRDYASDLD